MAKAKFVNGKFSAEFKGKERFVAEQMTAIKEYANTCSLAQEESLESKNNEKQITLARSVGGNLEHAVVAIYDNAGIPSFMHRFRKMTNKELFGGSDKTNAPLSSGMKSTMKFIFPFMRTVKLMVSPIVCQCRIPGQESRTTKLQGPAFQKEKVGSYDAELNGGCLPISA